MYDRLRAMWRPQDKMRMTDLDNEIFLVSFDNPQDYDFALTGGPSMILEHYLVCHGWDASFRASANLPPKMVVFRIDHHTLASARGKFARMAVEINLELSSECQGSSFTGKSLLPKEASGAPIRQPEEVNDKERRSLPANLKVFPTQLATVILQSSPFSPPGTIIDKGKIDDVSTTKAAMVDSEVQNRSTIDLNRPNKDCRLIDAIRNTTKVSNFEGAVSDDA
uniref:Uncharacterized protein n=1 Tax=Linum usitatissimum TaxID=4006 RepID=G8GJ67_LINUS|nr:hypothetical protein [Linum usitatissimum]